MPTEFQRRVYEICRQIPKGRVATYKSIADRLGVKAYQAVGQALNKNPYAPRVPCHRVVSSDGSIGGFATGTQKKKQILKKEGIVFEGGKIAHFEDVVWH